jgi:hypothetical protein
MWGMQQATAAGWELIRRVSTPTLLCGECNGTMNFVSARSEGFQPPLYYVGNATARIYTGENWVLDVSTPTLLCGECNQYFGAASLERPLCVSTPTLLCGECNAIGTDNNTYAGMFQPPLYYVGNATKVVQAKRNTKVAVSTPTLLCVECDLFRATDMFKYSGSFNPHLIVWGM